MRTHTWSDWVIWFKNLHVKEIDFTSLGGKKLTIVSKTSGGELKIDISFTHLYLLLLKSALWR